jgi:hypothetical protein
MAILKQVWNAKLAPARPRRDSAGGTEPEAPSVEFSVVREDRKPELLFSIMENQGPVRRRLTFALTTGQALGLARFLAGVSSLAPEDEDDEDGDRVPTNPGGLPRLVIEDPEP